MKLKKICAVFLSGTLAFSALIGTFPSKNPGDYLNSQTGITAVAAGTMRCPCDSEHPMLIVHIDTWNYADPAKIIALIPEDIKPYCVFNISMSINWVDHEWRMVQDGYELAKS